MSEQDAIAVCDVVELANPSIRSFEVDGSPRILVNCADGLYALDGICTHEEADLAEGDLDGTTLWCPLHASGFDVRTGQVAGPPAECPLKTFAVNVRDGVVFVSVAPNE